jgi:hypothetical protein
MGKGDAEKAKDTSIQAARRKEDKKQDELRIQGGCIHARPQNCFGRDDFVLEVVGPPVVPLPGN